MTRTVELSQQKNKASLYYLYYQIRSPAAQCGHRGTGVIQSSRGLNLIGFRAPPGRRREPASRSGPRAESDSRRSRPPGRGPRPDRTAASHQSHEYGPISEPEAGLSDSEPRAHRVT
eukprot:105009-Hanusia_phi.AAC.1